MNENKTAEETEGYGALGVLSKREAELEKVYDELIKVGTLHGIKILSRFAAQETAALREENERLKEALMELIKIAERWQGGYQDPRSIAALWQERDKPLIENAKNMVK